MVESENHDRSYYALIAKVAKLEAERSNLHVQMESLKSDAKAYQEVALEMDFRERKEPRQDCLFEGHRGLAVHVHRGTPGLGSGDDHIVEAASLSKVPPTLLAIIPNRPSLSMLCLISNLWDKPILFKSHTMLWLAYEGCSWYTNRLVDRPTRRLPVCSPWYCQSLQSLGGGLTGSTPCRQCTTVCVFVDCATREGELGLSSPSRMHLGSHYCWEQIATTTITVDEDTHRDLEMIINPSAIECAPNRTGLLSVQANHMHNRWLRNVFDTTNFSKVFARQNFNQILGFKGRALERRKDLKAQDSADLDNLELLLASAMYSSKLGSKWRI